ncbi:hypothetical protein [Rhodoferax sp.]|uniref:hypothetical protein n=1 Tax=Rhodoferax sp. TaxID=50421 RepID=UPI0025EBD884|nr:hypothetical protein [Rhodoferax sp.]
MKHKVPVTGAVSEPAFAQKESDPDSEIERIMARPDGYYWLALDGKQEFGPFESLELAQADMAASDEPDAGPGETLQEAEEEIGISTWIDPETGEPAEGQSPPRLEEE